MTSKSESLVAGAKQWAGLYGDFPNGPEGAVYTAALRVRAAWDANDAENLAAMFVDNGSMLIGDTQLMSREEIREYLEKSFAGSYKGSKLADEPLDIRLLGDGSSAVAITQGGFVRPGSAGLEKGESTRSMWVFAKRDGDWRVVSYQSSPLG